jgi:hypothetical protein
MPTALRKRLPTRTPTLPITLLALLSLSMLGGCAIAPPQPWEKGVLAKPEMTMGGDALEQRYNQHVYASKENASGGYGVGGGGCGCN